MSRILVSGATGLVGSRMVAALASDHEVFALSRSAFAGDSRVTPIAVDLATDWSAAQLPAGIDAVVHLAQSNRWLDFPDGAPDIFAINVAATAKLLDYASRAHATRFVLASTGGLYGSSDRPIDETTALCDSTGPMQYYFATKRSAETLALAYRDRMRVSILRPFFIYGDGQRSATLVPRLIDTVRTGSVVRIRGESGTVLNPVAVDDVIKVVEACLRDGYHGIVNVAGSQVTSIRSMVSRIGELLDVKPNVHIEPGVPDQFVADIALMRTLINCDPVGFDDGIAALLSGAKQS